MRSVCPQDESCDSNGMLDFPEFVNMLLRLVGSAVEEPIKVDEHRIEQIFEEWDTDGDGYFSTNDLRQVVERLGELWSDEQTLEMIHYKKADGMLTCSDLKEIINGKPSKRAGGAK